jgi:hypothetical protein
LADAFATDAVDLDFDILAADVWTSILLFVRENRHIFFFIRHWSFACFDIVIDDSPETPGMAWRRLNPEAPLDGARIATLPLRRAATAPRKEEMPRRQTARVIQKAEPMRQRGKSG